MRLQVQSLALLSGLRIRYCELCCCERWLGSHVAVAVAAVVPIRPPAWEPPYAVGAALKKTPQKFQNIGHRTSHINKNFKIHSLLFSNEIALNDVCCSENDALNNF